MAWVLSDNTDFLALPRVPGAFSLTKNGMVPSMLRALETVFLVYFFPIRTVISQGWRSGANQTVCFENRNMHKHTIVTAFLRL